MTRISIEFLSSNWPLWLALAPALVALALWIYYRTQAPLDRPIRGVLRLLRAMAFLIVLFALAEPVLTLVLPEPGKPAIAVLIDQSSSMELPESGAAGTSRATAAGMIAEQIERRLGNDFRLETFRFADRLLAASDRDAGGNTGIGTAIEGTATRQGGRPFSGALLITDGANTAGIDPVGAARGAGIPIFPIGVGEDQAVPDVRILQVRANPVASAGEPAVVEVEIASSGLAGRAVELRIEDQGRLLASRMIDLPAGSDLEQSIRVDVRPAAVGLRRWEARIAGASDLVGANDQASTAVRVLERKTRILFLEGRVDWDFAFLRRVLAADSVMDYTFRICDRNGRWLPERAGAASADPGDLRDYAAVILGEVPSSVMGSGLSRRLADFAERGGGLWILGGRAGLARLRGTPLESILPADLRPGPAGDLPLPVHLEPAGLLHPVTAVHDHPGRAESGWASLPPIWKSPDSIRPHAGSSLLLSFGGRGASEPALIAGFAGKGKVALLAAHGFWRWDFMPQDRGGPDADLFREFALRSIRWLAEPSVRDRIVIEPVRGVFRSGEAPEFTGRAWNEAYEPILGARLRVQIFSADSAAGARAPIEGELRARGADGTYGGSFPPLAPGAYRYVGEATVGDAASSLGRVESSFWVDANGGESQRLRPDRGTLEQIARASGGEGTDRAGLDRMLDRLPQIVRPAARVREIDLWNHILLFISFVTVLSVEWWLRRRRGLP